MLYMLMKKRDGLFSVALAVVMLGILGVKSFAADDPGTQDLSKALGQAKLFAGLSDEERTALKPAASLRHVKAGERIIEQGKTLDRMFIVLEGDTEVSIKGKCIATLSGQALVGEFEFFDMGPASADVAISKEGDIIELKYAPLNELMEKQPKLGCKLLREITRTEIRRLLESNAKMTKQP